MSKIATIFSELKKDNKKAFIPFIPIYEKKVDYFVNIIQQLVKKGANLIELGVPFSDPVADGKIIQKAHAKGIEK